MLTSLSLIFLVGLALAALCQALKLPRIIGMLAVGILLGPYGLNLLDASILGISAQLRQMALVIILLKARLSLELSDLKKVGRPAVLLSFVPASFEILGYTLLAPVMLGVTTIEAAVMGAVLGAVSPAVVVPRMLRLMEEGRGTNKGIPQMVLAGASCDDIFVIVLFSTFPNIAQGGRARAADLAAVPVSIVLGAALGAAAGAVLSTLFKVSSTHRRPVRSGIQIIVILAAAFLLLAVEGWLKGYAAVSGLLAVVGMACMLKRSCPPAVSSRLSEKLGELWLAAKIWLFVLVGAAVDVRYTLDEGISTPGMILCALVFRSVGVALCLLKTPLIRKERLFCALSYLPKATVQAAIGSAPLEMGLPCGRIVLSVAVLGILVTAPLGAFCMDHDCRLLLTTTAAQDTPSEADVPPTA